MFIEKVTSTPALQIPSTSQQSTAKIQTTPAGCSTEAHNLAIEAFKAAKVSYLGQAAPNYPTHSYTFLNAMQEAAAIEIEDNKFEEPIPSTSQQSNANTQAKASCLDQATHYHTHSYTCLNAMQEAAAIETEDNKFEEPISSTSQQLFVRCYKEIRNCAIAAIEAAKASCLDQATDYHTRSCICLNDMQGAAAIEEEQYKFEGKVIAILTIGLGALGITGAAINPAGPNKTLLETVKTICDKTSIALSPSVQGTSALCKGYQEPTKTRHTIAQTKTNENSTLEQRMDQEVRTIQSTVQHIAEASAIKT